MPKIHIGAEQEEVSETVAGFITSITKANKDLLDKLEKAKDEARTEIQAEIEKEKLINRIKDAGISLDGKESMEYLRGIDAGIKTVDTEPKYETHAGIDFDNVIMEA